MSIGTTPGRRLALTAFGLSTALSLFPAAAAHAAGGKRAPSPTTTTTVAPTSTTAAAPSTTSTTAAPTTSTTVAPSTTTTLAPTTTTTAAPTTTTTVAATPPPDAQGSWTSPEGVKINVNSAGPWTIKQVYGFLTQSALELNKLGPSLSVYVQDTYGSQTSSSASGTGGAYTSFKAAIYLQGVNSTFASVPEAITAHEYGHAWTMYHFYLTHQADWSPYLTTRWSSDSSLLLGQDARLDSTYNWSRDEIFADDYRLLFGSPTAAAQMSDLNRTIVDPRNQPGLKDWFLSTWA